MVHYKERDEESTVSGRRSNLTVNSEKLKDPTNVANAYNNFFITNTENIKHRTNRERRTYINSWKIPSIKLVPITEVEIKSTIHFLKPKKIISL